MNYKQALEKLSEISQEHLLNFWDRLNDTEKKNLLVEISELDIPTFKVQKQLLTMPMHASIENLKPFQDYSLAKNAPDSLGKELISKGQVGCIIVAGGQGTRLNFDGPKGLYPITPIKKKTLFQLFVEKVLTAGNQVGKPLPLAIMTSPLNHDITVKYFRENNLFGLNKDQLSFFSQGVLPFLDKDGNLFLERCDHIAEGPNGNGTSLYHFVEQGIWKKWHESGVRYVNFILIDNPLADPFDAELIGFHHRKLADVTIKCTWRRTAQEKVGVIVKKENKTVVVEYTELSEEERFAVLKEGALKHPCANISLFCFNMDFISRLHEKKLYQSMPLHRAFKAAKYVLPDGTEKQSDKPIAWKYERFIFDVLAFADKVATLLYPREKCFAPLKNGNGEDSVIEVQKALQNEAREVFEKVSGTKVPSNKVFELSQEFYYPTPELMQRWKGREFPNKDYVS